MTDWCRPLEKNSPMPGIRHHISRKVRPCKPSVLIRALKVSMHCSASTLGNSNSGMVCFSRDSMNHASCSTETRSLASVGSEVRNARMVCGGPAGSGTFNNDLSHFSISTPGGLEHGMGQSGIYIWPLDRAWLGQDADGSS